MMDILIKYSTLETDTVPINLHFHYADRSNIACLVGYEVLPYDFFIGDQILFQRTDVTKAGWASVQSFFDFSAQGSKPDPYVPDSPGLAAADTLAASKNCAWPVLAAEQNT